MSHFFFYLNRDRFSALVFGEMTLVRWCGLWQCKTNECAIPAATELHSTPPHPTMHSCALRLTENPGIKTGGVGHSDDRWLQEQSGSML